MRRICPCCSSPRRYLSCARRPTNWSSTYAPPTARSARDAGAWFLKRCRRATPRGSVCGAPTLSETSLLPPADEAPAPDPGEAPVEVAEPPPARRGAIAWWLVGLIIATDQIAKALVR